MDDYVIIINVAIFYQDRKDLHEQFEGRLSEVTAKQVDEWEARLAEVIANHESEKSHLVALHRENMSKALDEARKRWQKVCR